MDEYFIYFSLLVVTTNYLHDGYRVIRWKIGGKPSIRIFLREPNPYPRGSKKFAKNSELLVYGRDWFGNELVLPTSFESKLTCTREAIYFSTAAKIIIMHSILHCFYSTKTRCLNLKILF